MEIGWVNKDSICEILLICSCKKQYLLLVLSSHTLLAAEWEFVYYYELKKCHPFGLSSHDAGFSDTDLLIFM
jgi:hypothetical protein